MEFNLNDNVRVKLTPLGRKLHEEDHCKFWAGVPTAKAPEYTPPKEDQAGWSTWQLWALMEAFGQHTHIGVEPCFETTIELVVPND